MADGKTHYEVHKKFWIVLPLAALISLYAQAHWEVQFSLFAASIFYVTLGRYVDPDLDMIQITASEGRAMNDFGPFGYLFIVWWSLYAIIMNAIVKALEPRKGWLAAHRSWLTHSYIGTAIRTAWSLIPLSPFAPALIEHEMFYVIRVAVFGTFLALFLTDTVHFVLDRKEND